MAEKHYRSLVKGISWRITGSIDTMVISFLVTGKLKFALAITSVEFFTKIFLYYLHERVWLKVPFGRIKEPPPDKPNFTI
jgi:uncharacterized membrane protein